MANICSNTLYIEAEDTLSLTVLCNLIKSWQGGDFLEWGRNYPWLMANIIGYSGIDKYIKNKGEFSKYSMRGEMGDASMRDGCLVICFSTPWNPDFTVFDAILRKHLNCRYTVYYASDEPGCELFLSNSPDYIGKYYIDIYDDDLYDCTDENDDLYCADKDTLIRVLKNILSTKGISIPPIYTETTLLDLITKNDIEISVHKWEDEPYSTFIYK